jgi:hypothetical protein
MKKILLFALLFVSTVAFSQTQRVSTRNEIGEWSEITKKWFYGDMNYASITITFGKNYVSMDNRAESYYQIFEDQGEDNGTNRQGISYTSHSWRAYDKSGRKCILSMIRYNNDTYENLFTVMYDDVIFRYYYSIKSTDKFNQ